MNYSDQLTIMPLGAGCEVGRSCILLKFKGKTIMFDCGIHQGLTGHQQLPFFDHIDPSTVDLLLISHFHLDHCGAVPYFLEQTNFKGKVFMTYPTKAIYRLLLSDSAKVSNSKNENTQIFDKNQLNNSLSKIHLLDYHQELEYKGIKFTCYNAGHVIGAAMFLIEIDGVRVLYTGDYSREEDRHIQSAEIPNVNVDILIVESTYGVQTHEPRNKREVRFTKQVHDIIKRGGKCLLPVFALGRAQEILLILEEYWHQHQDLHDIHIYYPCALAAKCMIIFQTYMNMMGPPIREKFKKGINPFHFRFIETLKNMDSFEKDDPCVIMASPGMLQSGLSRQIFDKWCHDKKNGIIVTGYCVENTLAMQILKNPDQITRLDGSKADLNMSVSCISFSAHADWYQTSDFINQLKPSNVVLVHGEKHQSKQLQEKLQKNFPQIKFLRPENCQSIQFSFEKTKQCQVQQDVENNIYFFMIFNVIFVFLFILLWSI